MPSEAPNSIMRSSAPPKMLIVSKTTLKVISCDFSASRMYMGNEDNHDHRQLFSAHWYADFKAYIFIAHDEGGSEYTMRIPSQGTNPALDQGALFDIKHLIIHGDGISAQSRPEWCICYDPDDRLYLDNWENNSNQNFHLRRV